MSQKQTTAIATMLLGCLLVGCNGGDTESPDTRQGALVGTNGLSANGLSANGLSANGLSANGLLLNGLSANGLSANGLSANGLSANGLSANGLSANGLLVASLADPMNQRFMSYLVSCALPAGHSVTFQSGTASFTFSGEIGLAPTWENGACDQSCQRWVSACLLARVNHLGVHREISMRGETSALALESHELQQYPQAEATYFGNLFQPAQERYACLPPGATSISRVCGDSLGDCPMAVVGSCDDVCNDPGRFHSYRDCSSQSLSPRGPDLPRYAETISVFLPASSP